MTNPTPNYNIQECCGFCRCLEIKDYEGITTYYDTRNFISVTATDTKLMLTHKNEYHSIHFTYDETLSQSVKNAVQNSFRTTQT